MLKSLAGIVGQVHLDQPKNKSLIRPPTRRTHEGKSVAKFSDWNNATCGAFNLLPDSP